MFFKQIKNFYRSIRDILNHWFIFFEIVIYGLILAFLTFLYIFFKN